MQRFFWLTLCGIAVAGEASGQLKRQFTVENSPSCERISLQLRANSGDCYITAGREAEILNIYSNQDPSAYAHQFSKAIVDKTCSVSLNFENTGTRSIGQTISTRVFSRGPETNTIWKMYLSDDKPYDLQLDYGVGNAHVDLSGLAIEKLKINSGSADVNIGYGSRENKTEMDTLAVKVDLGSLFVDNINRSRARFTNAVVTFGNLTLDFSDGTPITSNHIQGSVGAGNLTIILPSDDIPVKVTINDSWLCSVKMPSNLRKVSANTFVNSAYNERAKNALTFDLDVSMGSIVFRNSAQ